MLSERPSPPALSHGDPLGKRSHAALKLGDPAPNKVQCTGSIACELGEPQAPQTLVTVFQRTESMSWMLFEILELC